MNVTIREAAEALGICGDTVVRWYLGSFTATAPRYYTVDSEALCNILGMDHRYMLAWLNGYDAALPPRNVCKLLGKNPRWLERPRPGLIPAIRYVSGRTANVRGAAVFIRYSHRSLLPFLPVTKERQDAGIKLQIYGGRGVGPTPVELDEDDPRLVFVSELETKGSGLPSTFWVRNKTKLPETSLLTGLSSNLPRWPVDAE